MGSCDINILVIGAGAAGMMAAIAAARSGARVMVLEKNEKAGKKLFITGKGRCNLANDCDVEEFFENVMRNHRFLYSALYGFTPDAVKEFFESRGLRLKTERGRRIFPASDHSSDVIKALTRAMEELGVRTVYECRVTGLRGVNTGIVDENSGSNVGKTGFEANDSGTVDGEIGIVDGESTQRWIVETTRGKYEADRVIIATGGLSYTSTGSTGDGLDWARALGHEIKQPRPSLVPLVCEQEWVRSLQGLSLKNVGVTLFEGGKPVFEDRGEMIFTHFGVSGPLILSASAHLGKGADSYSGREAAGGGNGAKDTRISIDLKPALDEDTLDARLLRDFEKNSNRDLINALDELLPRKLIGVVVDLSGIDQRKKVNKVSREERGTLLRVIKSLELTVAGTRGFEEAVITRGGVSVKDINPSTMESKKAPGLYFAGEIIDCDALTGGYNLQIAWSTGHLAGESAAGTPPT